MEYRFEIYRNTYAGSGNLEETKYDESYYTFERRISPIWNDLKFEYKRDADRMFFRKHLGGEFVISGNDYSWLDGIRTDISELSVYRLLYIKELTMGKVAPYWATIWKGFFNIANGEFDFSRCNAKFSELLVFDEYSALLENIETEVNLIDVPPIPVVYERHTYEYEESADHDSITLGITQCTTQPFPTLTLQPTPSEMFPDETEKWTLVKKSCTYGGQGYTSGGVWGFIYEISLEYRRDIQWASSNPDAGVWVEVESGDTLNKYARHYKNMNALSFGLTSWSKLIKNTQTDDYCKFWYGIYDVVLPDDLEVENERARSFITSIYHLINQYPIINEFSSRFFQSVLNPITGTGNLLNTLVLWQITDLKPTSDAATKAPYTFRDFENWLKMFQAGWYIDGETLVFEHRKYFDYGLSYTLNDGDYLDLTNNVGIVGKSKITYTDDLPHREELEFQYSNDRYFIGSPILCYGALVDRKEDTSSKKIAINNLSTDLTYIVSNEGEIGNDGFVMAATQIVDGRVTVYNPIISTSPTRRLQNAYISTYYLHSDYWKWWRSMPYGVMNEFEGSLFDQKNIIIEDNVVVQSCDETINFSPYRLVKTNVGLGKVEEAAITLKDKQLTLKLSHPNDATSKA